MNKPIKFELAKLLKEKGFDKRVKGFYDTEKELHENYADEMNTKGFANRHLPKGEYSAPTIAEVVMWLYEKHGIWICVSITIQKEYYYQCIDITGKKDSTKNNYPSRICKPGNYFNSPTEAYEAAIEYCLTKLI